MKKDVPVTKGIGNNKREYTEEKVRESIEKFITDFKSFKSPPKDMDFDIKVDGSLVEIVCHVSDKTDKVLETFDFSKTNDSTDGYKMKEVGQCCFCGRKMYDKAELNKLCRMPQPSGFNCLGWMR